MIRTTQLTITPDWEPKQQTILNLSEAARSLGVAQVKDDQDAISYWSAEVARFEREARKSTTDITALVEALDIALNGSRIDDLNRNNDDLWRTCYPVLNDHQRKIFEAHIKRLETALAVHQNSEG